MYFPFYFSSPALRWFYFQEKSISDHHWLRLPEFDDVSDDVIDYLLELYDVDMEMFGYHWDKVTNTASCVIHTPDGPCC